jgi:hypothetical protein
MNRYYKAFLIIAFMIVNLSVFAQDLIIQKNGAKIRCRILDEDSVSLYYSLGEQKTLFNIKRADIEEYFIAGKTPNANYNNSSRPTQPYTPAPGLNNALNKNEVFLLNFSAGFAAPVGKFGSKDLNDPASGLANTGYVLNASIIVKVSKYIGFSLAYSHQNNGFDSETFNRQLASTVPSSLTVHTDAASWIITGPSLGFYLTTPNHRAKDLALSFNFSVGYPKFKSPEITTTVSQNQATLLSLTQNKSEVSALAFYDSFGLNYKVSDYVGFTASLNMLSAQPAFTNVTLTTSPSQGATSSNSFTQKILTFNLQVGLTFFVY